MAVQEIPFEQICRPLGGPTAAAANAHLSRYEPDFVTQRLRESVPLLRRAGMRFTSITPGRAEALLPYRRLFGNQNSTLQASALQMAADYAAGVALGAALTATYVVGLHDPCAALPIQLWTAKTSTKYHRPVENTASVIASVSSLPAAAKWLDRLRDSARCIAETRATILVDGALAVESDQTLVVYAAPWRRLGDPVTFIAEATDRIQALTIGALSSARVSRLYPAAAAAAQRVRRYAPLLDQIIRAREKAIDDYLRACPLFEQVVWLPGGVHPDTAPRYAPNTVHYFVDQPRVLAERDMVSTSRSAVGVSADCFGGDWQAKLAAAGYGRDKTTLWIVRQLAWHLPVAEFRSLLDGIPSSSKDTVILADHLTPAALVDPRLSAETDALSRAHKPVIAAYDSASDLATSRWSPSSGFTAVVESDGVPVAAVSALGAAGSSRAVDDRAGVLSESPSGQQERLSDESAIAKRS